MNTFLILFLTLLLVFILGLIWSRWKYMQNKKNPSKGEMDDQGSDGDGGGDGGGEG